MNDDGCYHRFTHGNLKICVSIEAWTDEDRFNKDKNKVTHIAEKKAKAGKHQDDGSILITSADLVGTTIEFGD